MDNKVLLKLVKSLKSNKKHIALLAPSFPVDFKYPNIILKLRRMGFDLVTELTFGAKMVNKTYHDVISKNLNSKVKPIFFISSVCPSIKRVIEQKYPQLQKHLLNVTSPMTSTQRICKKFYPDYKPVFIGPCISKKNEAKNAKIPFAITFKELNELFEYFDKENSWLKIRKSKSKLKFDSLYNDYTKIYPISGGLSKTMHYKKLLKKNQVLVKDGPKECIELFDKLVNTNITNNIHDGNEYNEIVFFDLLFCKGGCIGGPGIASCDKISIKKNNLLAYIKQSKCEKLGHHKGVIPQVNDINFFTK